MNKHALAPNDMRGSALGSWLERSLLSYPERIAFRHEGRALSRAELLKSARGLADELHRAGLDPGEPVLIDLPHGLGLAVAMVAVVLAGGCAVPLDAVAPPARRMAIAADVNARIALVESETGFPEVRLNDTSSEAGPHDPDLLFLVYTSGSTGGPKGVKVSNTNYVSRMMRIVPADLTTVQGIDLCWTPASFIGMLDEVFFPLLCAKPSIIASPDIRIDPVVFAKLIQRETVTAFRITPSLLDVVLGAGLGNDLRSVTDVYCSGEPLSADLVDKAKDALRARIWCFYGATEAPGVAYLQIDPKTVEQAIGTYTPQSFVSVRIIDAEGARITDGTPGEILLGGDVISSGYWKRPALTERAFFTEDDMHWYRTGDLGQMHPDGRIDILGRIDLSERKINGTRISLAEVRAAIEELEDVEAAWVSVIEPDDAGQQIRLVGHARVAQGAGLDPQTALDKIAKALPSPARPVALLCHETFPLTLNGKLDAQTLLQMSRAHLDRSSARSQEVTGPERDVQPELLNLVLEVAEALLEAGPLKGADNFFRAGGNSLSAVQFALMVSDRIAHEVSSAAVFNADTFFDITANIQADSHHVTSSLRLVRPGTSRNRHLFTINSTGNYTRLATHLAPDLSVHNLSIFGLTIGLQDRLDCFELAEIAERFAGELLEACPNGPWPLLAYCQDGCLAVETARVLLRRTGICADLFLIDTFFTDHRPTLRMRLQALAEFRLKRIWTVLTKKGRAAQAPRRAQIEQDTHSGKVQNDRRLYARFRHHFMAYDPAPLDVPVTLLRSREWRSASLRSIRHMARAKLAIRDIGGEHNTLFGDRYIADLGSALNDEIAKAGLL